MSTCPQCGQENKDEARFCIKCGASLPPAAQAAAPPPAAEAPPPAAAPVPPQAAPTLDQPTAPAQPPSPAQPPTPPAQPAQPIYQQPPAQAPYAAPPAAYAAAPAYGAPAKTRSAAFWIGAAIVFVSGILVLVSTWMSWGSGPAGVLSLSGWDWFDIGRAGGGMSGEVVNAFFIYSQGYPIFTGLCSLILGILIALAGGLILLTRSKGLSSLAIIFSLIALAMAITNLTTIVRTEGISMGVGMYIFIAFSLGGLVGGGIAASG